MRTLSFIVEKQIMKPDPNCDFSGLVRGSAGYLRASFSFSPEWNGCHKVVEFRRNGRECEPQHLEDGRTCMIPAKALAGSTFDIRIMGQNGDFTLTTNRVIVNQDGGNA
jgi:hypothetical protein